MCIHIYAKVCGCIWMCMCVLNTCKDWYKHIYNILLMYEGHWAWIGESPLLCVGVCHSCAFNSMCTFCTISIVHCVELATHAHEFGSFIIVLCHLLSGNCWVACLCTLFPTHTLGLWVHHLHVLFMRSCASFLCNTILPWILVCCSTKAFVCCKDQ